MALFLAMPDRDARPAAMHSKLSAVATGGLIAGALDISYAIIFSNLRSGVSPMRLLQSVASGLAGRQAYAGGVTMAALGLGLHFFIALSMATAYVLAARSVPVLVRRPIVCGAAYGVLLYAFMNLVVIPLSRVPPRTSFPLVVLVSGLLVHMFFIGVPIALAARRAYAPRPRIVAAETRLETAGRFD